MSKFSNFKSYDGSKVRKRGYRKNEVWDEHKDFILDLVGRGEKQRNILEALKNERGFNTNLNQLKSKLGIWGVSSKNLAKKQRKWIYLMKERRQALGKETVFYFSDSGQEITESQLGSIMKGGEKEFSAMNDVPASPGELEMATPPPTAPDYEDAENDATSQRHTELVDDPNVKATEPHRASSSPSTFPIDSPAISQVSIEDAGPGTSPATVNEPQTPEPAAESQPTTQLPSTFENIYKKVLHSLESFHLAANSSVAAADNLSPIDATGNSWSVPPDDHATELAEWMEDVYNDAEVFLEIVHNSVKNSGLSFAVCRDEIITQWTQEYDEDPLPYHIAWSIVNGIPLKPVVNGWEDFPVKVTTGPEWVYTSSDPVIQRNTWLPAEDPPESVLTVEEWEQIDHFFTKYYHKLKKFSDKVAKSNSEAEFVEIFRQRAAHLQKLRHFFGEYNYYTILALEGFADVCFQIHMIPDEDVLFIYECATKAFEIFGLKYHESALELYKQLGFLRKETKNYSGGMEAFISAYRIANFRWGFESLQCIEFIAEISRCNFKLGFPEGGDYVLRKGLTHIQSIAVKASPEDYYTHFGLAKALNFIASVCKSCGRKEAANTIGRFSIQQFMAYRSKYTGTDLSNNGWGPRYMGEAFLLLKDYENAAKMFQSAFEIYSDYYGQRDKRAMDAISKLCRSMRARGLIMYTVPILEKTLMLRGGAGDENEEDEIGFEIWMRYMETVMRVSGRKEELVDLKKRLTDG
ncbi:hypothetical protein TWF788_002462 [Orbilia oligospora]|uniref:Clr5 domain-containing protein n=1 Tax=Orbilia oligospora TaxID=2813651 RepID=A0A7C8P635_ORBOL|nr:hypothetical protein TWF788_002462 [Orbilia oligospora]